MEIIKGMNVSNLQSLASTLKSSPELSTSLEANGVTGKPISDELKERFAAMDRAEKIFDKLTYDYDEATKFGELRDTSHIIRVNGKMMGVFGDSGFLTRGSFNGGSVTNIDDILESFYDKYGRNNVSVEKFSKGDSPTRAEIYSEFNGTDYYKMMQEKVTQANLDKLQIKGSLLNTKS